MAVGPQHKRARGEDAGEGGGAGDGEGGRGVGAVREDDRVERGAQAAHPHRPRPAAPHVDPAPKRDARVGQQAVKLVGDVLGGTARGVGVGARAQPAAPPHPSTHHPTLVSWWSGATPDRTRPKGVGSLSWEEGGGKGEVGRAQGFPCLPPRHRLVNAHQDVDAHAVAQALEELEVGRRC